MVARIEMKLGMYAYCIIPMTITWVKKYPPMNTARSSPAVVSSSDGEYLIVIGGSVGGVDLTATVELFQVKSRIWHKLTDLPQPLRYLSATICGD